MFKTRTSLPGTAPGSLEQINRDAAATKPVIRVVEYDKGDLVEREVASVAELPSCETLERVYWIEINGTGDVEVLRELGEKYHLHPLALEDVLHTPQRPKMEPYENYLFIVAQMTYLDEKRRICGEQVSMFLGKNLLITIQEESDFDVFNPVREIRGAWLHPEADRLSGLRPSRRDHRPLLPAARDHRRRARKPGGRGSAKAQASGGRDDPRVSPDANADAPLRLARARRDQRTAPR